MNQVPLPSVIDVIPHRPPFLFLDRCLSCSEDEMVGERHFADHEPFFTGHFPGHAIVPGVILLEGLAQSLAYLSLRKSSAQNVLLTGVDKCRIRHSVYPNQTVRYHVAIEKIRMKWVFARGEIRCGENVILTAQLKGFMPENTPKT